MAKAIYLVEEMIPPQLNGCYNINIAGDGCAICVRASDCRLLIKSGRYQLIDQMEYVHCIEWAATVEMPSHASAGNWTLRSPWKPKKFPAPGNPSPSGCI